MSFDIPESKSKRKGRIKQEDPVLFHEEKEKANNIENSMATDADILRYYEVTERLGSGSIINSNYWHNGRQIGYVEQQMVSFGHTSPQDKDNLRRYVKIELPKLEEQLKEKYERNKRKEKEEREALREATERVKKDVPSRFVNRFVKPTRISDELAKFLDKPSGAEMARTEVTRNINNYIRTHNLQDKKNGRKINPDSKLATLLKLKNTDELTYFNIQRYMSPHFTNSSNDAEIRLKPQREPRIKAQREETEREEEEFERRFKEEEKEKRYQEFKKNKSGLGLGTGSTEALPVAIAIAVPIPLPTLVVENSLFALKNKLWVSGH